MLGDGLNNMVRLASLQPTIPLYEALGFVVSQRWEDKGTLIGVMMQAGTLMLGLNQNDWKKGRDR
jgi:hypothetical protein